MEYSIIEGRFNSGEYTNHQSEIAEDEDTSNPQSLPAHTNQEGNIRICLLGREENFALSHEDCVHGGFCQACAERTVDESNMSDL